MRLQIVLASGVRESQVEGVSVRTPVCEALRLFFAPEFCGGFMNWNQVEGYWTQFRGRVREQWGVTTHSADAVASGKREQVVGLLQRRYGTAESHQDLPVHVLETSSDI